MRDGLFCFFDDVRAPVDGVLRYPVGQILLNNPSLAVDNGKHQGGEAGLGRDGKQFPALSDEAVTP